MTKVRAYSLGPGLVQRTSRETDVTLGHQVAHLEMLGFSLLILWISPGPVTRVRLPHEAKCPQLPIPYLNSVSDIASEYCQRGDGVFSR